jgi:hypothetical protein
MGQKAVAGLRQRLAAREQNVLLKEMSGQREPLMHVFGRHGA